MRTWVNMTATGFHDRFPGDRSGVKILLQVSREKLFVTLYSSGNRAATIMAVCSLNDIINKSPLRKSILTTHHYNNSLCSRSRHKQCQFDRCQSWEEPPTRCTCNNCHREHESSVVENTNSNFKQIICSQYKHYCAQSINYAANRSIIIWNRTTQSYSEIIHHSENSMTNREFSVIIMQSQIWFHLFAVNDRVMSFGSIANHMTHDWEFNEKWQPIKWLLHCWT